MVVWEPDPILVSADDALAYQNDEGAGGAREEAECWLRDLLSSGPVASSVVKQSAERDGIASRTLERAKKSLGVLTSREGFGSEGRWAWSFPHTPPTNSIDRQPSGMAHNGNLGGLCGSSGNQGSD